MKSPRFENRAGPLRRIFSPGNIERIWTEKVRLSMRQQLMNDGIESFDFHIQRELESTKLSQLILSGDYVPSRPARILVEKSKGLCRQLVIPSLRDAIVLQCLSDALYAKIRDKAPTKRAFFEPREHRFTVSRSEYGTFASWLNFQRELFNFSKTRNFIIVTDIANYYDSISYVHLRNVISAIAGVEECILDMLIYVLSDLLWQPDYSPRVEVGLPQINIDAPRLLAHCFLYELDKFLDNNGTRDFVRYMDDIDVGVDSLVEAKKIIQEMDLVLQTKQVRLNNGKTRILTQSEALAHFRVRENARLDALQSLIRKRRNAGQSTRGIREIVETKLRTGLAKGHFNAGSGEKTLKRWLGLAGVVNGAITSSNLKRIVEGRPAVREAVYIYIQKSDLSAGRAKMLADCAGNGHLVDDAGMVDLVNHLVETAVRTTSQRNLHLCRLIATCNKENYYGLYCRIWMQSKYDTTTALLDTLISSQKMWVPHERLGRLVGAVAPLFSDTAERERYIRLMLMTRNPGFRDCYKFHQQLATEASSFRAMYASLKVPNPSKGTGITHAKFLCLLSALKNENVSDAQRELLIRKNVRAFSDIYYRRIAKRLGLKV